MPKLHGCGAVNTRGVFPLAMRNRVAVGLYVVSSSVTEIKNSKPGIAAVGLP